jgi:hypothetical protein
MHRITALLVGLAALTAVATVAAAEDGCGRGWYFNGRHCAPDVEPGYDYPPPLPPIYYPAPPPTYYLPLPDDDYDPPATGGLPLQFGLEEARYLPPSPGFRTWNNCPPGFTVQDGLCKPYTGR